MNKLDSPVRTPLSGSAGSSAVTPTFSATRRILAQQSFAWADHERVGGIIETHAALEAALQISNSLRDILERRLPEEQQQ